MGTGASRQLNSGGRGRRIGGSSDHSVRRHQDVRADELGNERHADERRQCDGIDRTETRCRSAVCRLGAARNPNCRGVQHPDGRLRAVQVDVRLRALAVRQPDSLRRRDCIRAGGDS